MDCSSFVTWLNMSTFCFNLSLLALSCGFQCFETDWPKCMRFEWSSSAETARVSAPLCFVVLYCLSGPNVDCLLP